MNILLFEESSDSSQTTSTLSFLENTGFTIYKVNDVPSMVEQFNNSQIDIVLLNYSSNGVFELESFRALRASTVGYPLVVFSSQESQEMAVEAVRNGAQDYIVYGEASRDSIVRTLHQAIERNKIENRLREGQDRLKAILENSYDAFLSMDSKWNVTDWNVRAEATFGWKKNDVMGGNFAVILPQYLRRPYLRGIEKWFSEKEGNILKASGEILAVHKDGREFPIEIGIFKIKDDMDYMYCAFVRDITEKKNARDELERLVQERTLKLTQSNEELRQFAKIASHDLQEPLKVVQGFVSLLSEKSQIMDSESKEYIEFINDGAHRMQELIRSILLHSQIKSYEDEEFITNSNSVVEEVLCNLSESIRETDANFDINILPTVAVERTQLVQLFQNLISNSIKYQSSEKPSIHISAEEMSGWWLFSVRDKSIGIDPIHYDKIFDMFSRLHGTSKYAGTGMGLAICKKIVNSYGGRIWVESKSGEGSIFSFTLPSVKMIAKKKINTHLDILLVEDSTADIRLTKEALRRSGLDYKLEVVNDGAEAMSYLNGLKESSEKCLPGIILLDLNMPNKNGHDVLAEIKDDPDLKQIPVVLLTVSEREEDIIAALKLKMNYYLAKPVTTQKITALLKCFHELNTQKEIGLMSNTSEETHIRLVLAGNPHTSASALAILSEDKNEHVRSRVAENIHVPADVLEKLAHDKSIEVRLGVCENLNAPIAVLDYLSQDSSEDVRLELSGNLNCPEQLLRKLAGDHNIYVSTAATKSLHTLQTRREET